MCEPGGRIVAVVCLLLPALVLAEGEAAQPSPEEIQKEIRCCPGEPGRAVTLGP